MSYFDTCDLLIRAAANQAEKKAQRRATREAELWLHIRAIMAPLHKLKALSVNKPDKYMRSEKGREAEMNPAFVPWVTEVRGAREDFQKRLREAHVLVRDLYGMPMGNSLLGQMVIEMDMVLTMLEHTYKQVDEGNSTA